MPRWHNSPSKNASHIANLKTLEELMRELIAPPYGTALSVVVGFSGDLFFNNGMNLHACLNLFVFNSRSKLLYFFVKKIESTKYLKISL